VLVHAGDLTGHGSLGELGSAVQWLGKLPHKRKIVIAGNHDFCFQHGLGARSMFADDTEYLEDSATVYNGVKFYGSPYQPEFGGWAFNLKRGSQLADRWSKIPDDTEVLITHGPPFGILDWLKTTGMDGIGLDTEYVGCEDLLRRVKELPKLKLHVFGHIHLHGGQTMEMEGKRFVNAAVCDERYFPVTKIQVVEL